MTTLAHRPVPRLRRRLAGRTADDARHGTTSAGPRWERPAHWGLLALTALLFLYGLGASGYANSFYSAAAQAGSESWKAFLFGSLDSANAITVDKPPAALWPMALSVRLFGLGSWQILVPQALMGVATVAVLYASVRRRFGAGAALLAGGLLAVTPVAALMFRFNNPDALLCLLMVCSLYCLLRAVEEPRVRWLLLCGVCLGLGFLTKTLQAWVIVPPLAVVHLVCAPARLPRRIGQLLLAGLAMVVSSGWWVALAELWPAASRPYIGGSQHNSFLELTLGYNGLGRITGEETGSAGPPGGGGGGPGGNGGPGGGMWGESGIGRLFGSASGGQISWLLPAALLLLVAGLVLTRRAARTDAQRAALLAWGGSLLMTAAVFSFMSGIYHDYYTVALAPYIAAVVAMGAVLLWRNRAQLFAVVTLACAVAGTAVWSYVLLGRADGWLPWLRWAVLAVGVPAALALLVQAVLPRRQGLALSAAALGIAVAVAGPVAYTLSTVHTPKSGSIVTAGPSAASSAGRFGPGAGPGAEPGSSGSLWGTPGAAGGPGAQDGRGSQNSQNSQNSQDGRNGQVGGQAQPSLPQGQLPPGAPGRQSAKGGGTPAAYRLGAMGGLLGGSKVSGAARTTVAKDAADYTWAAAAIGSQNAASYQLATQRPVMAIGGFNGSDPAPTLARFKEYVRAGEIHYFIGGSGTGGPGGGRGTSSGISDWVTENFTKVTVGDVTLYDLTKEKHTEGEQT